MLLLVLFTYPNHPRQPCQLRQPALYFWAGLGKNAWKKNHLKFRRCYPGCASWSPRSSFWGPGDFRLQVWQEVLEAAVVEVAVLRILETFSSEQSQNFAPWGFSLLPRIHYLLAIASLGTRDLLRLSSAEAIDTRSVSRGWNEMIQILEVYFTCTRRLYFGNMNAYSQKVWLKEIPKCNWPALEGCINKARVTL